MSTSHLTYLAIWQIPIKVVLITILKSTPKCRHLTILWSRQVFRSLCSAAPTRNTPEASEVGTSLYLDGTNGIRIIEVPLYYITKYIFTDNASSTPTEVWSTFGNIVHLDKHYQSLDMNS